MSQEVLLKVKDLRTEFFTSKTSSVTAVANISFDIYKGEILGLVGESGCGKSVTSLSIMQLLKDTPGKITNGEVVLDGVDLITASDAQIRDIRGGKMSMIFQEPMSSLNPSMRIDKQMIEGICLHTDMSKEQAREHAAEMLKKVGIPDPQRVLKNYPHQLSGGMSQRVMIAMAMSNDPQLLIADEPTTALDVTIQAQILDLMKKIQKEEQSSILLITHDLGVVAKLCDRIAIMYGGKIVEIGSDKDIFYNPKHPYTEGLLRCISNPEDDEEKSLTPIAGSPPDLLNPPKGCPFVDRCEKAMRVCKDHEPEVTTVSKGHQCACWLLDRRAVKE